MINIYTAVFQGHTQVCPLFFDFLTFWFTQQTQQSQLFDVLFKKYIYKNKNRKKIFWKQKIFKIRQNVEIVEIVELLSCWVKNGIGYYYLSIVELLYKNKTGNRSIIIFEFGIFYISI